MKHKILFRFYRLHIPFKESFAHASAARKRTQTIWVEAFLAGFTGYGEGCPRSYVTGESEESACYFFNEVAPELMHLTGVEELKCWVLSNRERIDANPAAWCAIELALLDLFGKLEQKSIEGLLGLRPLINTFHYSAIVGLGSREYFEKRVQSYLQLGMTDIKLKVDGRRSHDVARLAYISSGSEKVRLRLDANNCWSSLDEAAASLRAMGSGFFAVEEPLRPREYENLGKLSGQLKVKIIVDESFQTLQDIGKLKGPSGQWILNMRVSKLGGILRSLEIAEAARALGISIIVGAQVGETSLLTRAGMTVANVLGEQLLAQEGAFGTHLLSRDVCSQPLMFGRGGILREERLGKVHGFGLAIDPDRIKKFCR